VFGGRKAAAAIDGTRKAAKAGQVTLSVSVAAGTYEIYGIASYKPRTAFTVKPSDRVCIVRRDDPGSQRVHADLVAGKAGQYRRLPEPKPPSGAGENALITLVRPGAMFGERCAAVIDGKERRGRPGTRTAGVEVVPGAYDLRAGRAGKIAAAVTVRPGELLYVARDDARSQRMLGDIMYENRAKVAAMARYRRSLAIDPDQQDLYRRYADLALETGGRKEAVSALERIVAAGQADGQTYQTLGDLLLKEKRTAEAQAMYDKAIAAAGGDAAVLAGLGAAKRKSGDIRGAVYAYQKAVALAPDSAGYCRSLGELYWRQGDSSRAIEAFQAFFERGGSSSDVALKAGAYHYRHGRMEDAVRYLLKVSGKPATQFDCLYMLGASYYSLGQYGKAADKLGIAAVRYPKHARWPAAAEMLIECYLALKDDAKAEFWVNRYAQVVKRGSADIAFYRAHMAERKSIATARSLYEKNVKAYPSDHRNYLRLGLLTAKDPASLTQSVSLLKRAVALADTIPEAWLEIARVYRQLGKPDEEFAALRVFLAAQPQHPEANARMGELMLGRGKTEEAVARLETAERAGTDDPQVLAALARGYLRSGRQAEALAVLERAKRGAPEDIGIRERLIELYQASGQQDKVLVELKELLALRRDNATLLTYAKLAFAAGQHAEAVDAIENIRATDPQNIEALMLLGKVLRAQQKYEEAVDIYKEVSYIDPAYVPAMLERAETHLENSQPHWAEAFYTRVLKEQPKNARAHFGLAMVAKLRMQYGPYRQHLQRAVALAPADPVISQEYELSMQSGQ